jgi:formyltetrahydrofolate-dependent phosphoribosylglycinamide formyltransferase
VSRARIAVLASGSGSNLQAVLDHLAALGESRAADVVVVVTDRENAGALQRASEAGIDGVVARSRLAPDMPPIDQVLAKYAPDLIVLAGYVQHIPAEITRQFHGRIVNVHPALLPKFGGAGMYGARVHRAVIAAGETRTGPTVHFVDDEYDHGPVIAQWPVPVLPGDDDHTLAARVLHAEHFLFPRVVQALAAGEISLSNDGQVSPGFLRSPLPLFDPELSTDELAEIVAAARR